MKEKVICKLCLQEKKLRNSHILPEFMYSGIYDKNPKRFYEVKYVNNKPFSRIEQKGKREYLLCADCEVKLSKYERYADETLNGKNRNNKTFLVNISQTVNKKNFLYEFEKFDYKSMKIFLDSLLWRLIISKSFATPEYGYELVEKLRLSILNEVPLDENEFPCLINSILSEPGKQLRGFIISPVKRKYENGEILSVFIDGFEYNFFMDYKPSNDGINPVLQKNGDLKIFGILLSERPDLIEFIKDKMDYLEKKIKGRR
jgi:hypothetical protein